MSGGSSSIGDVIGGVLGAILALVVIAVAALFTVVLAVRWWLGKGSTSGQGK